MRLKSKNLIAPVIVALLIVATLAIAAIFSVAGNKYLRKKRGKEDNDSDAALRQFNWCTNHSGRAV